MLMFGSPSDNRCRPDGPPGLLAEEPVTRLVSWIRDPSPEPPRTNDRFQFRDRRPRDLLVRSRVGVGGTVSPQLDEGQWHPRPCLGASMVGRRKAPNRDGRTRCRRAPPAPAARSARLGLPCADALPRAPRRASPCRRSCSPPAAPRMRAPRSTRPARARPTARSRAPTRTSRRSSRRRTAGRRRDARLGTQLHAEQSRAARVARHRRGPLRGRHVDVRGRAGRRPRRLPHGRPDADDLATFYAPSAQTAARTKINGDPTRPSPAGRAIGSTRRPRRSTRRSSSGRRPSPTSSTSSSATTCPTRGSRTRSTRLVDADVPVHRPTRARQAHRRPGGARR